MGLTRSNSKKQASKNSEWTSLWVEQYSRPELQHSRSSPAGTSNTLSNNEHYLFSPPTPDSRASDQSFLDFPAPSSRHPPSTKQHHHVTASVDSNHLTGRPLPLSLPVKPLVIKKREHRPLAVDSTLARYGSRALPTVPRLTVDHQEHQEQPAKGLTRVESKSRRRPIPIILSPSFSSGGGGSGLHPPSTEGLLVITPSWANKFTDAVSPSSSSTTSSPFLQTPSSAVGIPPSPPPSPRPATQMHSARLDHSFGRSPTYHPLPSAGLRKKERPAQDIPGSAVIYEERLLCSEGEGDQGEDLDSLYADELEEVYDPGYNLNDMDLGIDDSDLAEFREIRAAYGDTMRFTSESDPWHTA